MYNFFTPNDFPLCGSGEGGEGNFSIAMRKVNIASKPPDLASCGEWTAERVKSLRLRLGLTQSEAGAYVGVGKAMWCHWELNKCRVTEPFRILLTLLEKGRLDTS